MEKNVSILLRNCKKGYQSSHIFGITESMISTSASLALDNQLVVI